MKLQEKKYTFDNNIHYFFLQRIDTSYNQNQ